MKLSDTHNPRTGEPLTIEQIQKGASKFGLTWKNDNTEDPVLSKYLQKAVLELGWTDPVATVKRAAFIQSSWKSEPEIGVTWYGMTVWVDGVIRDDLDWQKLSNLSGVTGERNGPQTIENPDMDLVERCKYDPRAPRAKSTQTWEGDDDLPTYS